MILFFEHGRLGNQLFQACGLKKYYPTHKLVLIGCKALNQSVNFAGAIFISENIFGSNYLRTIVKTVIHQLARFRILGQITEDNSLSVFKLSTRRGLLWNTYVAINVFFQHNEPTEYNKYLPSIKPELLELARLWLMSNKLDLSATELVFLHVRRGDYLFWPSKEFPAVLPLSWYKRSMDIMLEKYENPTFVLMSDDLFYLKDLFEEVDNCIISDNTQEIDLAIMSLCSSGILSASSFAWWGANLSRIPTFNDSLFLAPKYWCGHRSKSWYPPKFQAEWITYLE